MGLFDFVGTFFFLSLGITFVLILLLVYHFKQRLTDMEQKSDKMFEIVNTIVKEMGNMRRTISQYQEYQGANGFIPSNAYEGAHYHNEFHQDEEEEDDEEPEHEDNEEDDDDEEQEEMHTIVYNIGDANRTMNEFFHINAHSHTGDEFEHVNAPIPEEHEEEEEPQQVKVVSVDLTYNEEDVNTDEESSTLSDFEGDFEPPVVDVSGSGEELIHVNKLEETMPPVEDVEQEVVHAEQQIPYHKMNLTQLRAYAVSRGLLSDSSKMKKAELIKLLETNDE